MKKQIITWICAVSLVLSSCNSKSTEHVYDVSTVEINLNASQQRSINSIVDSISYIGLEFKKECPIKEISKIAKIDSTLLIFDWAIGQIMAVDANTGNFKYAITNFGQGPEEFLEIRSFCADNKYLYVVDNVKRRLMKFDINDGSYISSSDMPVIADDVERLNDGRFIFACVPLGENTRVLHPSNHRIFITDDNMQIVDTLFPYDDDEHDPMGQRFYLFKDNDGIVFGSLRFNGFTLFNHENLDSIVEYHANFDKPINKDVRLSEVSDYQFLTHTPLGAKGYYYLTYTDGKGKGRSGVWDSHKNEFLKNDLSDITKVMGQIIGSLDDCMVMSITGDIYEQMVSDGFPKAPSDVEQILREDGNALVLYHLK